MVESNNDNINSQFALKSIDDEPMVNSTKSLPPRVNRADKPKIPPRSALIAGKANLEPRVPAADERVSPFSTPPSSDESVGPEPGKLNWHGPSRNEVRGREGSQSIPRPDLRVPHETQAPSDQVVAQRVRGSDARRLGFTQGISSHQSMADDTPGLPPRRPQDKGRSMQGLNSPRGQQAIPITPFAANSVPSNSTTQIQRTCPPLPDFLPPPKRASMLKTSGHSHAERSHGTYTSDQIKDTTSYPTVNLTEQQGPEMASYASPASDYPEVANSNRQHPYLKKSMREIPTNYDTRLIDACGQHICTTGHLTKVWDLTTGELILSLGHGDKEIRVTALAFKPGVNVHEEGLRIWLGTSYGDIQEVDIGSQSVVYFKSRVHDRREIIKIFRYQSSMWTLDDGGKLCVWLGDETGLPDLQRSPFSHRVPKGHTFSIVIQDNLWMATGKDIRIFRPNASEGVAFSVTQSPLTQPGVGTVTSGAVISGQLDRVYFGHADGKVTIYSTTQFTCLGVVNVSVYKINSLAGAGSHLWAGYNTGMLYVYDTRTRPWATRKDWPAHSGPIMDILVDRSSLWKYGVLRVVSLGADNTVRFWDGTLEDDWLGRQ